MPRGCVVCGRQLLAGEEHLCSCCLAELPLTHFESMTHNPMADRFNSLVEAPGYERAAALFYYTGDYARITQALKYRRNFGAGRWFARMLGERLAGSGRWNDVDAVCCVPLHWTRRFARGYNQAEIIAKEVVRGLGVRFEPHLLRRVRRTDTQTRLSAEERSANVAGAFEVRKRVTASRVLLIDDVFTTGATLASCAAALREACGPQLRICVATLGYAEHA